MTSQVYGGAAEGAVAGYRVSGTWQGAVIGAVVGGVGGIFGDKAAKYRRKARTEEQRAVEIQQAQQRRSIVRSIFLARSEALAAGAAQETGGLQSSGVRGVLSSVSSQGFNNLKFFDALVARQIMQQYYLKKAGKNQGYSDMIGGIVQMAGSSGGGGGMGGLGGGGTSTQDATQASNSYSPTTSTRGFV